MGSFRPQFPQVFTRLGGGAIPPNQNSGVDEEYVLDPPGGGAGTATLAQILANGNTAANANLIQGLQALVLSSQNGAATVALIGFDSNPGAGLGYAAPIGSVGFAADGTLWIKTGALATQWTQFTGAAGLAAVLAISNDAVGDLISNMGHLVFKTQTPAGTGIPSIIGVDSDPSAGGGITATDGSLAVATDGTLWDKTGPLDTNWTQVFPGGGGGGGLLAVVAYSPVADGAVGSTTSAAFADLDAANAVITFTAPASGNVLVRLSGVINSVSGDYYWGLREASTDLAGSGLLTVAGVESVNLSVPFLLTGLAPGAHTLKWSHRSTGNSGTYAGPSITGYGPITMEVWPAP